MKQRKSRSGRSSRKKKNPAVRKKGRIVLEDVILRRLTYEERQTSVKRGGAVKHSSPYFRGALAPRSQNVLEFEFCVRVQPDRSDEAYALYLVLGARFRRDEDTDAEEFVRFVVERGGSMVLPYAREIISNITSRSAFKPLFIDPMLLDPGEMDAAEIQRLATHLPALGVDAAPWSVSRRLLPGEDLTSPESQPPQTSASLPETAESHSS